MNNNNNNISNLGEAGCDRLVDSSNPAMFHISDSDSKE